MVRLKKNLTLPCDELSPKSPFFRATTSAHGLYNTNQFVLRLSPSVHQKLSEAGNGIKRSSELSFDHTQAMSTFLHETVHWWQHIGSTYGFVFGLNYPLQAHVTHFDLSNLVKQSGFKKSVLSHSRLLSVHNRGGYGTAAGYANSIINNHFDIMSFRDYTYSPKSATQIVKNKLFESVGHTMYMTYGHTLSVLASTVDREFRCIQHPKEWEQVTARLRDNKVEGYFYGSRVIIYPIGSYEIFEGQARFAQIQYLFYASGQRLKWDDFRSMRMLEGVYVTAFNVFLESVQEPWPENIGGSIVGLFMLICDLAINPSAGFPFALNLHFETFLHDVNPGYRFIMFCMLIRTKLSHLKNFIRRYDRDEYEAVSEQLCSLSHDHSPVMIAAKFSGWFNEAPTFALLKKEFDSYSFKAENFVIRDLFSHFLDFQASKHKRPEFFCWPGIWMAGDNVSTAEELIFERHSAIFVDKESDDGVFARIQTRFSEANLQSTFQMFYDGVVSYDLIDQWISRPGKFKPSLEWLNTHVSTDEAEKYLASVFSSTFNLDIKDAEILPDHIEL